MALEGHGFETLYCQHTYLSVIIDLYKTDTHRLYCILYRPRL